MLDSDMSGESGNRVFPSKSVLQKKLYSPQTNKTTLPNQLCTVIYLEKQRFTGYLAYNPGFLFPVGRYPARSSGFFKYTGQPEGTQRMVVLPWECDRRIPENKTNAHYDMNYKKIKTQNNSYPDPYNLRHKNLFRPVACIIHII